MLRVRQRVPTELTLRHTRSVRFDAPYTPSVVLPTIRQAPLLRSVHLPLVSAKEAQEVASALRELKNLQTIVMQAHTPPPPFPVAFLRTIEGHETLETISLVGCGLKGAEGAHGLLGLIKSCKALTGVWAGRNGFGGDGGLLLASAASEWRRAKQLSLPACALTDKAAMALVYAASQFWPLISLLDLRRNLLGANCITAMHSLRSRQSALTSALLTDPLPPPPPPPPPPSPSSLPDETKQT
jgi:hypothetical protein